MFTKEMVLKIDAFLRENLDIMFKFEFNGLLLFYGDSLKRVIIDDIKSNNYEFVLLCYAKDNVIECLKKYKIKYKYNKSNGYYFKYKKMDIYIRVVNDLCYVGNYSTDFLFYDICRKQIIPIGVKRSILKREIIDYNEIEECDRSSLALSKKFIDYFSNNHKKIKIKKKNNSINIIDKLKHFFRG